MDNPEVTTKDLMEVLPGPDFSNWCSCYGEIRVSIRPMRQVKVLLSFVLVLKLRNTKTGRERIVVTEFLYMVNKTKVHEHIVRLVQEKRIEGITAVRDESKP